MSDEYIRLAAPVYPEMQYCYSPVQETALQQNQFPAAAVLSSPRTKRSQYHLRKKDVESNIHQRYQPIKSRRNPRDQGSDSSDDEEEDGDDEEEEEDDDDNIINNNNNATNIIKLKGEQANTLSLDPSVDSVLDSSSRSLSASSDPRLVFPVVPNNTHTANPTKTINAPQSGPISHAGSTTPTQSTETGAAVVSALTAMIAEKASVADNPFAEYAFVAGKGENKPVNLCVYLPHSSTPYKPVKLVVRPDAIIDDVIGYILYDYVEQKRTPEIEEEQYDLAQWSLLMAEDDGEVEDDLPALDRMRKIDRVSFDQFALCRATPSQIKENEINRSKLGRGKPDLEAIRKNKQMVPSIIQQQPQQQQQQQQSSQQQLLQVLSQQTEPDSSAVAVPVPSSKAVLTKSTMPMTPIKYFRIRLMTNETVSATTMIGVDEEMFIGDVLDLVSRKRKLDPEEYMLTIADTNMIVPNDTPVEGLPSETDLCLTKKGTSLTIPTSANHLWRSPIKKKKEDSQQPMYFSTANSPSISNNNGTTIDGDYIHLMPPEHKGMFDSVKTTSFHVSAIRTCKVSKKLPSHFKIVVMKERDYKTYALEAESAKEAC
ncbi:stress-activated map kinase interacting protein 1-domain-containing protein, partial [Phycomyces blakesleeanus]